jgi:uncharacterized repeat protein (TIGR03803 family)
MYCPRTGVVYKLDAAGKFTVLHRFGSGSDGAGPRAGVIRDPAGNLYGTTFYGGGVYDYGTVYQIDAAGNETVLHSFTGPDGAGPYAGLTRDAEGNLYGTTTGGGAYGYGVVFQLDTTGNLTVLYSFTGGEDGAAPFAPVIRDSQGSFYDTTSAGGLGCSNFHPPGCGVVFKPDTAGNLTALHIFNVGLDGGLPLAGLIRDTAGNFYGTTSIGAGTGCPYGGPGCGAVFKLDTAGNLTVLYAFGQGGNGSNPNGLIYAAGYLYGTTQHGGGPNGSGGGVVFKLR